jgi:hypothetical protein
MKGYLGAAKGVNMTNNQKLIRDITNGIRELFESYTDIKTLNSKRVELGEIVDLLEEVKSRELIES